MFATTRSTEGWRDGRLGGDWELLLGKSTWLAAKAEDLRAQGREPIEIDFDRLAVALGSQAPGGHGHAEQFTRLTQRIRGLAIKLALAEAHDGATVLIVDASPTEARWQQYRDAQAEIVTLDDVPLDELHRRASAERPEQWHRYIDEWQPTAPEYQSPPQWHKRPDYRKGTAGRRYSAMRARFLAGKTHCESCGKAFVTNAMCEHPRCRARGKGCYRHPLYPTVQHTQYLADGAPSLDVTTWAAFCLRDNLADGGSYGHRRRAHHRSADTRGTAHGGRSLALDW